MKILEVTNLAKSFGGLLANSDLSFFLNEKEILGLIGPNGAGKTTTFNLITGIYKPDSGKIFLDGDEITRLRPDQITAKGIARTFQGVRIFLNLTLKENLMAGLHLHSRRDLATSVFQAFRSKSQEIKSIGKVKEMLDFFHIADYIEETPNNLPHLHQALLGIAMAVITEPKVLLLDEPLAGLNSEEIDNVLNLINKLRMEREISVLMVEHVMKAVMTICDRLIVLDYGRKIAEGSPVEISQNEAVIEAYLGRKRVA